MNNPMYGRYPAIVKSYDKMTRTCRVEIPGISSGGDALLVAEIDYPLGDKASTTEIEVLAEDTVWVEFIGGDTRYPVVTSYRNPQVGNSVDWRRWHHANIELTADGVLKLNANIIELNSTTLTHNGKNIGDTHTHIGVQTGSGTTGAPS